MEFNIVRKKLRKGLIRVAYVFPSTYEAMASSLVSHMIYFMLNELFDEIYVERFHLTNLFGEEPPPRSLETSSPLKDFDLIITSIHYEPVISGLIRILDAAGISPFRKDRSIPIIAGGPGIMANPHPFEEIIDAFIIGEVEESLPRIMEIFIENMDNKKMFLEELSSMQQVYVPGYSGDKIFRSYHKNLDEGYYPIRQFQHTEKEPVYGRGFLLETSRGCKYWCRFCMEGRLFKPYRYRSYSVLKELVEKGLDINNLKRVIIFSLIFLGNPNEKQLLEYLVSENIQVTIPSLRVENLRSDTLELLKNSGQKMLTIAPESFSPFIQRVIGKYIDVKYVYSIIESVIDEGFDVKLYVIVGFKGETFDDVKETIQGIKRLAKYARTRGRKITVTVNPLVPKPKTMFQWIGMMDLDYLKHVLSLMRRELRGLTDTRPLYANWAWIQASISLADKRIGKVLVEWSLEGADLGSWRRVIKRTGFNTRYVFDGYSFDTPLPWDDIVISEKVEELSRVEYLLWKRLVDSGGFLCNACEETSI